MSGAAPSPADYSALLNYGIPGLVLGVVLAALTGVGVFFAAGDRLTALRLVMQFGIGYAFIALVAVLVPLFASPTVRIHIETIPNSNQLDPNERAVIKTVLSPGPNDDLVSVQSRNGYDWVTVDVRTLFNEKTAATATAMAATAQVASLQGANAELRNNLQEKQVELANASATHDERIRADAIKIEPKHPAIEVANNADVTVKLPANYPAPLPTENALRSPAQAIDLSKDAAKSVSPMLPAPSANAQPPAGH